jgi:DNA mismatch repair ATPase MutL
VSTLELYREQVEGWGWHVDRESSSSLLYRITHCPVLMVDPVVCLDSSSALHTYLAQLSHSLRSPRHIQLPSPILYLLHSRACKTAIRFGDRLSPSQQHQLMTAVGQCNLPFQCAHGRPSMQPLIDLRGAEEHDGVRVGGRGGRLQQREERLWKEKMKMKLGCVRVMREVGVEEEQEANGV